MEEKKTRLRKAPTEATTEEAMADKASFTKEEWMLLLKSPMIAGMAVTAADPSGLWGLLKESFAGGTALTRAVTGADTATGGTVACRCFSK